MLTAADLFDPSEPTEPDGDTKLPDPDTAAMLMLWRTHPKEELERRKNLVRDLRARLLELAPPGNEIERKLTTAILTGKGNQKLGRHPALLLAERQTENNLQGHVVYDIGDLAASWVLYAALKLDEVARLSLSQLLFNLATAATHKALIEQKGKFAAMREAVRLDRLAASWIRNISPATSLMRQRDRRRLSIALTPTPTERLLSSDDLDVGKLEAALFGAKPPERDDDGKNEGDGGVEVGIPQTDEHGNSSVRLVYTISDEGKDGAAIRKRYAKLTKPLPLMGGRTDIAQLVGELDRLFPWTRHANQLIGETLTAMQVGGRNWFQLPPLLLLGPAGSGKTAYATTLARLAGTASGVLMLGGSSDNRSLMGTSRGWGNYMPSFAVQMLTRHDCANPLIVGDEIDKVATSRYNGNVQDTLLTMLEPTSARRFFDEALLAEVDLSFLSWVLTANSTDTINETLLSRMTVLEVELPGAEHAPLLFNAMLADVAGQFGLEAEMLPPLMDEVRDGLIQRIADGVHPLRRIKAAIRSVVAKELSNRHLH